MSEEFRRCVDGGDDGLDHSGDNCERHICARGPRGEKGSPGEHGSIEADLEQLRDMDNESKCCSGVPMQENLANEGYCCAKPTDEELEAEEVAEQIANDNAERLAQLARERPAMIGGTRRALDADAIVILNTDGTYEIAKNRHTELQLGLRVEELTVLYLANDIIVTLTSATQRVRNVKPHVRASGW